jgi:type II secretion system protein C
MLSGEFAKMNFQTIFFRLKSLLPLPRVLLLLNWIAVGLLCITIGIFSAGIFENQFLEIPFQTSIFRPPTDEKLAKPMKIVALEPIITYNIFNAEVSSAKLSGVTDLIPTTPGKNLKQIISNLQLVGVTLLQRQYAVCVIKNKKEKREEIFGVNDSVFGTGAVVKKILIGLKEQKVYLQLNDEVGELAYQEEKELPSNKTVGSLPKVPTSDKSQAEPSNSNDYSVDGKNFRISSGEVDSHLNNFAKLLNQARMVPYFRKGQHKGYQIKAIDKGSLYEKLGLKNNDVIEEINGDPLDSMEKVMGMFKKLRNEREFSVKLSRKGAPQHLNYYLD